MRQLILAHRHEIRFIEQDVRGLEDRVAQKSVRGHVAILNLFLFFLVGRVSFQPRERRYHREQEMQDGMFRDPRLDEHRGFGRVDARGQPVDQELVDELTDAAGVGIVRRERVPIRDEEITLVLVLQAFPILQRAEIVAEMEQPARLHAAEDSFSGCGHGVFPVPRPMAVERIVLDRLWVKVLVTVWMRWICGSKMISPIRTNMP